MGKKIVTRFPIERIKKIMQADEDVGLIAEDVPLLLSKALELFLQHLCDRTCEITRKRRHKVLSSMHLKECVHSVDIFYFLEDVVRNVPDFNSVVTADDLSIFKKRKVADVENDGSDKESNRRSMEPARGISRGRGRGRPRGRGRGRRVTERQIPTHQNDDDDPYSDHSYNQHGYGDNRGYQKENNPAATTTETTARGFDLNVDLDENGEPKTVSTTNSARPSVHLANLNRKVENEDEDYDEENKTP